MASVVRISNSPLVRAIPWTTQGIQDESWMNWTAESLRIPTYFKYKEFIQKVKAVTIFAIPGTQHGLFVRHFFGYRDAVSATAGNAKSEVGEVFFALRLIDFIASELRGPIISSVPTTPWPLNVKLLGQNLAVVKLLKDWQEVITVAEAAWNSYKTENEEQHTKAEIAVLPGSPETLRSQALYHNYVTSFRRHPYEHVMCNFRLAAFVLGWYFAGEFDTSKNFVLEQLKQTGGGHNHWNERC
ncbi:hypothetical protein C8F04DRAFT_488044 [Mycena alexandri]|uniref:Uncharacterized protein n=1 Tax=Mycena alexandri TaxID=1745969 RepID=A0AAD6X486_9AGAR|nr:hypothetical protein C8F04DRAFT_488044 [Mycena alexandri]